MCSRRRAAVPTTSTISLSPAVLVMTPLTPAGRASVARLQMNRPQQIKARRRWILLSLFP
jgi:hypothetical protein